MTLSADPQELARFAGQVLTAANTLTDSLDAAQTGMTISASDFGNSAEASPLSDTHTNTIDAGTGTVSRLQAVLTNDVDALYQVAFALQTDDEASANALDRI